MYVILRRRFVSEDGCEGHMPGPEVICNLDGNPFDSKEEAQHVVDYMEQDDKNANVLRNQRGGRWTCEFYEYDVIVLSCCPLPPIK